MLSEYFFILELGELFIDLTYQRNNRCRILKSENNSFRRMLHDDGKGYFSIEMDRKPAVLPYLANEDDLVFNRDTDQSGSPFKASIIFDMEQNMISLGDVRDKDFRLLRSAKTADVTKLKGQDSIGKLTLSETGRFEVYDNNNQKLDIATNFKGKSHLDYDMIQLYFL